ncbi:hypothetical protein LWI28_021121 [Acer negundo]|uniref:Uncharacterized protein n=1 Tax=Acer negundo TaxID=4023 RepID=A0AAD5IK06_ACENE|nr:hypothetical protein LWI28_021121 [Acer negundo]
MGRVENPMLGESLLTNEEMNFTKGLHQVFIDVEEENMGSSAKGKAVTTQEGIGSITLMGLEDNPVGDLADRKKKEKWKRWAREGDADRISGSFWITFSVSKTSLAGSLLIDVRKTKKSATHVGQGSGRRSRRASNMPHCVQNEEFPDRLEYFKIVVEEFYSSMVLEDFQRSSIMLGVDFGFDPFYSGIGLAGEGTSRQAEQDPEQTVFEQDVMEFMDFDQMPPPSQEPSKGVPWQTLLDRISNLKTEILENRKQIADGNIETIGIFVDVWDNITGLRK